MGRVLEFPAKAVVGFGDLVLGVFDPALGAVPEEGIVGGGGGA